MNRNGWIKTKNNEETNKTKVREIKENKRRKSKDIVVEKESKYYIPNNSEDIDREHTFHFFQKYVFEDIKCDPGTRLLDLTNKYEKSYFMDLIIIQYIQMSVLTKTSEPWRNCRNMAKLVKLNEFHVKFLIGYKSHTERQLGGFRTFHQVSAVSEQPKPKLKMGETFHQLFSPETF
ncbi:S-adenosyl-L-methionine-dependent methyltransferase [Rhizophagus irregularis DAOM 181602=DAOM 197198]|uniref:Uncharacterized protein n=1 Tax=Rhizophagus irregularis (strain DAOM 181602 / DAOM 197198 / MUCL 43194) TaxID=747089 RepID=A0A2P4QRB4_RHIID|nr:hypothetical protein GLOIN_2v1835773 [Rhizophagus irregularis DAOM 181602=DAOM 197198]POG80187.1 hypothetical protein GLOIN_2v1835773 [Rhizophagus irregularis DAOM 181602=DAOM 197198]GET59908.1 S-adenosyl-L-methionine-dependent methyltransferase [Rhizophagus irregularis DAOM 181602=DAOM 197198]|eukprot:XP_025187053.1 hypothetical protein GLOIN_2v1835773 [Rhizophagus irregularis DAOM 181602=DAOM 197198]